MICGIVHKNPHVLDAVKSKFQSAPGISKNDWVVGENFVFGVQQSSLAKMSTDGLCSRDGLHVVVSGEISAKTDSAAGFEELYRQYGDGALSRSDGQFCSAIWDEKNRELRLFLDRSGGIKTLYYAPLTDGLVFCSSFARLQSALPLKKEIDDGLVRALFATGYVLPPGTLLQGVRKLRPGEMICYIGGRVHCRIVDRVSFDSSSGGGGSAEELIACLTDALERLSVEPETGFLLSGGVDSSVLVALATQRLHKNIKTFCASFPGSPLDESAYAKLVASANKCSCEVLDLSQATALDELPEIVWHLGEPFLDFSVVPTFHLFKQVREKTGIVISGDGPDHLFGRYYPLAAKRYFGKSYPGMVAILEKLLPLSFPRGVRHAAENSLLEAYRCLFAHPAWGADSSLSLAGLLNVPEGVPCKDSFFFSGMGVPLEKKMAGYIDAVTTVDFAIDGACGVFAKVGRMAEAQGLTLREPYLARAVSDCIARLPLRQKQRGTLFHLLTSKAREKYLLKYIVGPRYLPREILKKRKGGFDPPLNQWLRETLCLVPASRLLCSSVKNRGYFDVDVLTRLLREHRDGVHDWSFVLFLVVSFDLWVRLFIENDCNDFPGWKLRDLYG